LVAVDVEPILDAHHRPLRNELPDLELVQHVDDRIGAADFLIVRVVQDFADLVAEVEHVVLGQSQGGAVQHGHL